MTTSILTNPYATEVKLNGVTVSTSKNLRGMRDYARISPVVKVTAQPSPSNPYNGLLDVLYANGATSSAHFASYAVMLTFISNRRSWRSADIEVIPQPVKA
jgi:hypothetical protein